MVVVIGVTDLFFQSKIIEVAHHVAGDIVLASTQDAVLQTARELHPTHVILDLNEQKFDAIETIKKLKQLVPVPVVGFVSHVQRDVMARAKSAGCDTILAREVFVKKLPELLQ